MRGSNHTGTLLRALGAMPFCDRGNLSAVTGIPRKTVDRAMKGLETGGLVASLRHATGLIPAARRYCLTANGLRLLADREGTTVEELLSSRPLSGWWQHLLLGRLDAVAVVYRLTSAVASLQRPLGFRWYRALPMDACISLPDGRVLAVVRQGPTAGRTAFSKRMWRLREDHWPGAVLMLLPDEIRLRHARRMLRGWPMPVFLALERQVASGVTHETIWRLPSVTGALDLGRILSDVEQAGEMPWEPPPLRTKGHLATVSKRPQVVVPETAVQVLLNAADKRTLDAVYDWPWITLRDLSRLMGLSLGHLSDLSLRLEHLGLLARPVFDGNHRLALTDQGLALLARRDRTSMGLARRRWSVTLTDSRSPLDWRNVSGRRARQLLRNLKHTQSVHWFLGMLAEQARLRGWEVAQFDPPPRAARHFRHHGTVHSVHPDAFGILRRDGVTMPLFLEWERRAVRPSTMAVKLAPYLRYYSSRRPTDDHGAQPLVLVVFDDDVSEAHFLRVAHAEMDHAGVTLPLFASQMSALELLGPLGPAWRAPGGWEPAWAFGEW